MEKDSNKNVEHQRFMRPPYGEVKINQKPRPKPLGSNEDWKEVTIEDEILQKQKELKRYESSMDSYRQVVKVEDQKPNIVILNTTKDDEKTHSYFRYVIGIIILAILLFSNPSEEAHRQAVIKFAMKENSLSSEKGEFLNNLETAFTYYGAVGAAPMMVFRKNYLLFSITELKYNGEKKDIGIGILGTVILYVELENWIRDLKDR